MQNKMNFNWKAPIILYWFLIEQVASVYPNREGESNKFQKKLPMLWKFLQNMATKPQRTGLEHMLTYIFKCLATFMANI